MWESLTDVFYPALRVAGLTRGECSWRGEARPNV